MNCDNGNNGRIMGLTFAIKSTTFGDIELPGSSQEEIVVAL